MANTVDILGDDVVVDSIITRTITEITDDSIVEIGLYAFRGCTALTTANFPVATDIGSGAFFGCIALTEAYLPVAKIVANSLFSGCTALTTANFPVATSINGNAFSGCTALTTANFPVATSINMNAFSGCTALTTIILRKTDTICSLYDANVFAGTPIANGTGYIYVPASLVDSYKTATNWSTYANQIRAIEDYPDVCFDWNAVTSIAYRQFEGNETITSAIAPNCVTIGDFAFDSCTSLTTADFPIATSVGECAFASCTSLTTADFPMATSVSAYMFEYCTSLTTANFPAATEIGVNAFQRCRLTTVNFPAVTSIGGTSFSNCTSLEVADFPLLAVITGQWSFFKAPLTTLILRKSDAVCELANANSFQGTPIANGTGYIYVPASLVDTYKTATNWSTYANQFRALEDYTVDGTITGALDESKI